MNRVALAALLCLALSGCGEGFRAFHYRLPNERLAVVILSNVDEADVPWIARSSTASRKCMPECTNHGTDLDRISSLINHLPGEPVPTGHPVAG